MKRIILIALIFAGCDRVEFNCQCDQVTYELINSEWIETNRVQRMTECGEPFFNISHHETIKVVTECK